MYSLTVQPFLNKTSPSREAEYALVGAPLDITSSYRSGTRFAPNAIRRESQHLETLSDRTGLDWADLSLIDRGDIELSNNLRDSLKSIEEGIRQVHEGGKVPFLIGGEHTSTLAALRALEPEAVIVFDAHLDLRDTLFNRRLSHGTYLRRGHEEQGFDLVIIGARSLSKEEVRYAEENRVELIKSRELRRNGLEAGIDRVKDVLMGVESVYLSIDMDALDPSEAPAVANPSPEGLSVTQVLDLINGFIDRRFMGFDLTEVTPLYDSGLTSIQAAYMIMETLYCFEASRRQRIY
ncbi:MAG: agmatinase [Candidatus Bathyarchaeia archaeon]